MPSERLRDAVWERRIYAAEHVAAVLPGPRDEPVPWRRILDRATARAKANGLGDQPFFRGDPSRFRRYVGGKDSISPANWLRDVLEEAEGVFVEFGHGLPGIRRAGKVGLRATAAWWGHCQEKTAESHNRMVENARPIVALPSVQLKLLLPPGEKPS